MELNFKHCTTALQEDGDLALMVIIPKDYRAEFDKIKAMECDKLKTLTLKYYRDKRSLNANSFCWVLINKMAQKLGSTDEEIYEQMLKKYGQKDFVAALEEAKPVLERVYRVVEVIKDTTIGTKQGKVFRLIRGSSTYDTSEMSVLIDGIVSEAKELKIETMTPDEINQLKERWGTE